MPTHPAARARLLALLIPAALLAGALGSQYLGGLYPCEMCHWQRWPHYAAVVIAALAFTSPAHASRARLLTALAALAIAISGLIGVYHAGVEYGWWAGASSCTANAPKSLEDLIGIPLVRCDEVQWSLFGISLAGFNAIISLGGAAIIAILLGKRA